MTTQWFYDSSVQRFRGLSTDTKPTDCTNGSVFIELDTAKIYLFNESALTWHAIPANGSGNYNDLSNKPSINGVTLSGDKSLADIGIVNPLIIKGRVDSESDLPSNAQTGWVYFVGLTTDEELDEYVYTVDGEWELLGTSHIVVDSALSTTSENPVQNKVIANALNSKIGMEEVYGRGIQIPNGTDLHNITTPGSYYCGTAADAATLLNCPVPTGFHLVVTNTVSPWGEPERVRHDLYPTGSTSSAVYSENLGSVTSTYPDGWRPWGVVYNIIDINSDKAANLWWSPQTVFGRPYGSRTSAGKLTKLSSEFVDVLVKPTIKSRTNNYFETDSLDGTNFSVSTDYTITTDKMFLLSPNEVGLNADTTIGSTLDYYLNATNTDRIKYRASNETAYYWWLRTPGPTVASLVRYVNTSGALNGSSASSTYGVAAACVIQ